MDLTKKHCLPCEGGVKPFADYLKMTRGWQLLASQGVPLQFQRKFEFKDFKEAIEFVNKVADLANSEDHHPDIFIHNYKKVDVTLSTHAIGGLSENDFIMASKINLLI